METWDNGHLDKMIDSVFARIKKVLVLVVEGKGSNKYVEIKCGKKHVLTHLPPAEETAQEEGHDNQTVPAIHSAPLAFNLSIEFDDKEDKDVALVCCDL